MSDSRCSGLLAEEVGRPWRNVRAWLLRLSFYEYPVDTLVLDGAAVTARGFQLNFR